MVSCAKRNEFHRRDQHPHQSLIHPHRAVTDPFARQPHVIMSSPPPVTIITTMTSTPVSCLPHSGPRAVRKTIGPFIISSPSPSSPQSSSPPASLLTLPVRSLFHHRSSHLQNESPTQPRNGHRTGCKTITLVATSLGPTPTTVTEPYTKKNNHPSPRSSPPETGHRGLGGVKTYGMAVH